MFTTDKAPFLLSVLLAMCGWTFSQLAARLSAAPYIEYSLAQERDANGVLSTAYTLANLSRTKTIKISEIRISFDQPASGLKCSGQHPVIRIPPPLISGRDEKEPECADGPVATLAPPPLPPNSHIEVEASFSGLDKSAALPVPQIRIASEQSILLSAASLETRLVKHDVGILTSFFALWLIVILLYFVVLALRASPE